LRKKFVGWSRKTSTPQRLTAKAGKIYPQHGKYRISSKTAKHVKIGLSLCKLCFQSNQRDSLAALARKPHQYYLLLTQVYPRPQHGSSRGCSKRKAVETARAIYHKINPSFESACNMPLSAALVNVQELNIEEKKTKNEKRKVRRRLYKKSK
jgi:hypothetical protein